MTRWEETKDKYAEWWKNKTEEKDFGRERVLSFMEVFKAAMFQATWIEYKDRISHRVDELMKEPDHILDEAWEATKSTLTKS